MPARFNPPPNWPQPDPGWQPPAGWTPDPTWGPPPPGWNLWVDEQGRPVSGPGAKKGLSTGAKVGLWVGGGLVALCALFGIIGAIAGGGDDESPAARETSTSAAPDDSESSAPAESSSAPAETTTTSEPPPAPPYNEQFSGTGDGVVTLTRTDATQPLLVTAGHQGSSNFVVQVLDQNNQPLDLVVNTIGAYAGTSLIGEYGDSITTIQITADGPWTLTAQGIAALTPATNPASGTGDAVVLLDIDASTVALNHAGSSNFVVQSFPVDGGFPNLAVNDIGPYQGTVPFTGGIQVVEIKADGAWTLTVN